MDEDDLDIDAMIQTQIRTWTYYVEYPGDIGSGVWKDRGGDLHYICDMTLDHLKNSAHTVKRDIERMEKARLRPEVLSALLPQAKKLLAQLEAEFKKKAVL